MESWEGKSLGKIRIKTWGEDQPIRKGLKAVTGDNREAFKKGARKNPILSKHTL